MEFQTPELERAFDAYFAQQNRLTDLMAHFLGSTLVICISCRMAVALRGISCALSWLPVSTVALVLMERNKAFFRHRNYFMAALWYLAGLQTLLLAPRLGSALTSGQDSAVLRAIILSKWPHLAGMLFLYRLKIGMLPHVYFPSLVMFHFASVRTLHTYPGEAFNTPTIRNIALALNQGVARALALVPGLPATEYCDEEACGKLPILLSLEQWLALYWLGMQALVFWLMVWLLWRVEKQQRRGFALSRGLAIPVLMRPLRKEVRTVVAVHAYIVALLLYLVTFRSCRTPEPSL